MDETDAMERAKRVGGNMGYILMGIGNVGVVFFIITVGLENQLVFADTIWCIVLDTAAILLTWWYYNPPQHGGTC